MEEALWVARVGVSDVTVLAGIAAATSDFTNGAKACFEDCSNRNFFKVWTSINQLPCEFYMNYN